MPTRRSGGGGYPEAEVMKIAVFIILFVAGLLFLNAAQIPALVFGGGREPDIPHWKSYTAIGVSLWLLIVFLANVWL